MDGGYKCLLIVGTVFERTKLRLWFWFLTLFCVMLSNYVANARMRNIRHLAVIASFHVLISILMKISSKSLPQKYSRDLYVRLREQELHQLEFIHLCTEVDISALCKPICGFTEWSGSYNEVTISMGWDWVLKNDLFLLYSTPQLLRTNCMLVNEKGYDLGSEMTSDICERVVASLPWHWAVMKILHDKLH